MEIWKFPGLQIGKFNVARFENYEKLDISSSGDWKFENFQV